MATPTHADAELILKLYEARREPEIRKARQWWTANFWPESADDIIKIASSIGSPENAWMRMVLGYWSMAGSFVTNGVLNEDLFFEPSCSARCSSSTPRSNRISKKCARRCKIPCCLPISKTHPHRKRPGALQSDVQKRREHEEGSRGKPCQGG